MAQAAMAVEHQTARTAVDPSSCRHKKSESVTVCECCGGQLFGSVTVQLRVKPQIWQTFDYEHIVSLVLDPMTTLRLKNAWIIHSATSESGQKVAQIVGPMMQHGASEDHCTLEIAVGCPTPADKSYADGKFWKFVYLIGVCLSKKLLATISSTKQLCPF